MSPKLTILQGDCREQLAKLPPDSVHCVVTSPPYWGLRDYQTEGQLGLEKTPDEYVANMVAVFREVKRVLHPQGSVWLNLGDGFAGSWGDSGHRPERDGIEGQQRSKTTQWIQRGGHPTGSNPVTAKVSGLKPKDLVGIPWRVAFALQAGGWWLRSDIIWSKPNPMPESVTDRPTKAHEYVFLLTKAAKYFYDAEAIKEPATTPAHEFRSTRYTNQGKAPNNSDHRGDYVCQPVDASSRNRRTVWTINTEAYPGKHYAVMPRALVKPCILAGTSAKGCCPKCGKMWERMVADGEVDSAHQKACGADSLGGYKGKATKDYAAAKCQDPSAVKARILAGMMEKKTVGWQPTCKCGLEPISCTVLDPFGGSGTTGLVSLELGRSAILIELNPEYVDQIKQRCHVTPGLPLA